MLAPNLPFSLGPNEKTLWLGFPKQGLVLRRADALEMLLALLPLALFAAWNFGAWFKPSPLLARLWGPMLLAFLLHTGVSLIIDARARARSFYALTNERVLIQTGAFTIRATSLELRTLPEMTLEEHANRLATIHFGPTDSFFAAQRARRFRRRPPAFEFIPQGRAVFDAIRAAQREALDPQKGDRPL